MARLALASPTSNEYCTLDAIELAAGSGASASVVGRLAAALSRGPALISAPFAATKSTLKRVIEDARQSGAIDTLIMASRRRHRVRGSAGPWRTYVQIQFSDWFDTTVAGLRPRSTKSANQARATPRKPRCGVGRSPGPRSVGSWLARKDSNLRSPDPESGALPLGHSPVTGGMIPQAAGTTRAAPAGHRAELQPCDRALAPAIQSGHELDPDDIRCLRRGEGGRSRRTRRPRRSPPPTCQPARSRSASTGRASTTRTLSRRSPTARSPGSAR